MGFAGELWPVHPKKETVQGRRVYRSVADLPGSPDTAYVTDNLALEPWVPRDDVDQALAQVMSDYWVRFATTGDPNGGAAPLWPVYGADTRSYLELGDEIEPRTGVRPEHCDLHEELLLRKLGAAETNSLM